MKLSLFTRLFYKYLDPSRLKKWNALNLLINGIENNVPNLPEDLRFAHTGSTIIGSKTKFGWGVVIGQNVTFGSKTGMPTIGNNVRIYANCVIVGNIKIGDNSIIGANSFIDRDIPENSIVYPKQELVIKKNTSKDGEAK